MIAGESLAELLKRPFGGWMFGDVDVEQSPRANLHCNEHVQDAELAVTTVKKSQATIAWAWFLTKVDQRCEEAPRGPPVQRRYL